jgi:hypothetical protein
MRPQTICPACSAAVCVGHVCTLNVSMQAHTRTQSYEFVPIMIWVNVCLRGRLLPYKMPPLVVNILFCRGHLGVHLAMVK